MTSDGPVRDAGEKAVQKDEQPPLGRENDLATRLLRTVENDLGNCLRGHGVSERLPALGAVVEDMIREFRRRVTGADHGDLDPRAPELDAERIRERVEGVLARAISTRHGKGALPDDGGNINNEATPSAPHAGERRLCAGERTEDVDGEEPLEVAAGNALDGSVESEAGVVDEDVDAAVSAFDLPHRRPRGARRR